MKSNGKPAMLKTLEHIYNAIILLMGINKLPDINDC